MEKHFIPYKGYEICISQDEDGLFSYCVTDANGDECISMSEDFGSFDDAKKAAKKHVTRGLVFVSSRSPERGNMERRSREAVRSIVRKASSPLLPGWKLDGDGYASTYDEYQDLIGHVYPDLTWEILEVDRYGEVVVVAEGQCESFLDGQVQVDKTLSLMDAQNAGYTPRTYNRKANRMSRRHKQADASDVASIIKNQIGMNTLMSLGAHNFMHTSEGNGGLVFNAKILPFNANGRRGSGARVMQVQVILNGRDLYDIKVGYLKSYEWIEHYAASDVYADNLANIMLALDYDGDTVLNPRYAKSSMRRRGYEESSGRSSSRSRLASKWMWSEGDWEKDGDIHFRVYSDDAEGYIEKEGSQFSWIVEGPGGAVIGEGLSNTLSEAKKAADSAYGSKTSRHAMSRMRRSMRRNSGYTVRVIWEGELLEEEHFSDDQEYTAEAYYNSTVDKYNRQDDSEGISVQLIDDSSDYVEFEHYFSNVSHTPRSAMRHKRSSEGHTTTVERRTDLSHGYPWVATCTCGWKSRGYVAEHAAQMMADDHESTSITASRRTPRASRNESRQGGVRIADLARASRRNNGIG